MTWNTTRPGNLAQAQCRQTECRTPLNRQEVEIDVKGRVTQKRLCNCQKAEILILICPDTGKNSK